MSKNSNSEVLEICNNLYFRIVTILQGERPIIGCSPFLLLL